MDERLLDHYNVELRHLREMGTEFAKEFPRIAARLGMNALEVRDPYVERILEGAAFLTARVQLKLEAEFPQFTQALLELVYPHCLAPTPSMLVAQFTPKEGESSLAKGFPIERTSAISGALVDDNQLKCDFRTAQDVTLWPIRVESASYFSFAPDLALNSLPVESEVKGGVRIRLKTLGGVRFRQTAIDRLPFFLGGRDDVANRLCELCIGRAVGVVVVHGDGERRKTAFLPPDSVRALGFDDAEAVLPVTHRSFQGYRLLQEFLAFPKRFRFFEITGLGPALQQANTDDIELVLLFGAEAPLERLVNASNFALFCTPAINLFSKRADRIHVTEGTHEYHVVPDAARPLDFEVYRVAAVGGHGGGSVPEMSFHPFYTASVGMRDPARAAYFTTRRQPRLLSSTEKRDEPRSNYPGTEVFLSIVDAARAPFSRDLRQLSVNALCTNRDLVFRMRSNLSLDATAPVSGVHVVDGAGPTPPYPPLVDGAIAWQAISHLSLNYLSLVNTNPTEGAAALRKIMSLYAPRAEAAAKRQIDGIRSVEIRRVVGRLPEFQPGEPLVFGRGMKITVDVDELAFEGGSAFIAGSVFGQFFRRYASINSFTETVLRSQDRREIGRWMSLKGARATL